MRFKNFFACPFQFLFIEHQETNNIFLMSQVSWLIYKYLRFVARIFLFYRILFGSSAASRVVCRTRVYFGIYLIST